MKKVIEQDTQDSRRTFIKALAYVTPVVVTLKAEPSFARNGSGNTKPTPKPGRR